MTTEQTNNQEIPSDEQVTLFYTQQIEILKLRKEYSVLQKEITEADAARYEALAKIAYFQGNMGKPSNEESEEEEDDAPKRTLRRDAL